MGRIDEGGWITFLSDSLLSNLQEEINISSDILEAILDIESYLGMFLYKKEVVQFDWYIQKPTFIDMSLDFHCQVSTISS